MTDLLLIAAVTLPLGLVAAIVLLEGFIAWKNARQVEPGVLFLLFATTGASLLSAALVYWRVGEGDSRFAMVHAQGAVGLAALCSLAFLFKRISRNCFLSGARRNRETSYGFAYLVTLITMLLLVGAGAIVEPRATGSGGELADTDFGNEDESTATEEPVEPASIGGEMTLGALVAKSDAAPEEEEPEPTPEPEPEPRETEMVVAATATPDEGMGTAAVEPAPVAKPAAPAKVQPKRKLGSPVFARYVKPILDKNCTSCHGPDKQKGGLRLDTPTWIRNGGKAGPVVMVGKPDRSPLYTLTVLPKDDPDIMPAKGAALGLKDTEMIRKWILHGADLGDGEPFSDEEVSVHVPPSESAADALSKGVSGPDGGVIEALKKKFVIVRPASANGSMLDIDYSHAEIPDGALKLEELLPIAANIFSLDLTKTDVGDADLAHVAKMSNLNRLHLNRTGIGDAGLASIKDLKNLQYLNLYGTKVTDSGLAHLYGMKRLQKIFLWQSKATDAGAKELRDQIPGLVVSK